LRQNKQSCILDAKVKTLDGGEGSFSHQVVETGAVAIVAQLCRLAKGGTFFSTGFASEIGSVMAELTKIKRRISEWQTKNCLMILTKS
jgi:hypothetical protein